MNQENKEVTVNQKSNMSNIHQSLLLSKEKSKDLTYFVEDDYIHEKNSLLEMLFTYEKISSLIRNSEFKRRQAPPILKLSTQSLGNDWRLPIAIANL